MGPEEIKMERNISPAKQYPCNLKLEAPATGWRPIEWGLTRRMDGDGLSVSNRYQDKDGEWKDLPPVGCDCGQKQGLAVILGFIAGVALGFVASLIMIMYGG